MGPSDEAVFVQTLDLGGDGLRLGIKDSIDIAGYPTRAGCAALAATPPADKHAAVVAALLEGGCRIVGKTNMHELAYGVTGINAWTGTPRNTRYPDRVPGGSSSGSAVAVAAKLVDFAIGTDTGGSVRVPAACCGVFGLKPTFGRISRAGVHPALSTLDCIGPFARDVDMIERAMSLMDASYKPQPTLAAARIGMLHVATDPAVEAAVATALYAAGMSVSTVSLPSFDAAFAAALTIIGAETWAAFGHLTASGGLGADVQSRLLDARGITPDALAAAEIVRVRFRAEVDAALECVDAIALPTLRDAPPALAAATDARAALRLTDLVRQFNLSGHPALTVPLETQRGLPAGLQLVGRLHADSMVCAVARHIVDGLKEKS
jgi:amidase